MDIRPYPVPVHRPPARPRHPLRTALAVVAGAALFTGLGVAGSYALLRAVDPMGDEWICSDGEAPAGVEGAYNQCFEEGATLPAGFAWDPYGNRPMPYNCDQDGWVHVARPDAEGGVVEDCVAVGTEIPDTWARL